MKKYFLFLLMSGLLFGCTSNTSKKDEATDIKSVDSIDADMNSLSSTKSIYTLLCQDWGYKDDVDEVDSSDGSETLGMPYRGFSFFADSTVVKNPRDDIRFGKWFYNDADKMISIKYEDRKSEKYKIMKIGAKDMTLIKNGDDKPLIYVADGKQEKNYANDPFYFANNSWRIKPKQPETDDAIKERLRECIQFYILFFKDNLKRDENSISLYGLPSCFNWYQGGISIKSKENLDPSWVKNFYNSDQAMQAQQIMVNLITKKYNWDTTERNWVKQSMPVLQQIHDSLK
jgi:hypothetical protein